MRVGVIADDLTGANATGVGLAKKGFTTATIIRDTPIRLLDHYNAICIDTDSRYTEKSIASNRVKEAVELLKQWDAKIFCKRIDSTIRGNIGIEIDSLLHELGESSIGIVVPSYPSSGRITVGGYLLVEGTPVQETDAGRDPVTPIEKSFVASIIENQSRHPVTNISLDIVLSGKKEIASSMLAKIDAGYRIIVVDALNEEQIEAIAQAMVYIQDKMMIPVDPGPLTSAYAKASLQKVSAEQRLLVTVGSVTSQTGLQLEYLIGKTKANPVYVDPKKLATYGGSWQQEVDRAIKLGLESLTNETILIVTTYHPGNKLLDLKTLSKEENKTEDALAKRITDGLAAITRKIIEKTKYKISGCFTSGGDVTASFVSVTYSSGIELEDEVIPLAAYGRLIGGHLDQLPIVTKGGMIGDAKAIYKSVRFLQMKSQS
ncbi:MAG: four-carbon acid sugar kinase family protein [Bacillota bacterium]|nr:four-carbon acid sugar kinase family protein [Bacillota bacterium]